MDNIEYIFVTEKNVFGYLDDIYKIYNESFTNMSVESLNKILTNENNLALVALIDNKVIGYVILTLLIDVGEIYSIAVLKDYRRKNIADNLLKNILEKGKEKGNDKFTLDVRKSNISAINLYVKNGFKEEACRPSYYSDPKEDAIIMWKYIIKM